MTKGQESNIVSNKFQVLDVLGASIDQETQQPVNGQQAKIVATTGNAIYFQQAQQGASGQLGLKIQ